jgi:DNA-binding transcriptional ArsR family regulator
MDHDLLTALRALADPTRLRLAGRLAGRPATESDLAAELGLSGATVRRQLTQLVDAGLVAVTDDVHGVRYALRPEAIGALGRALAALEPDAHVDSGPGVGPAGEALPADVARVLRGFFEADRLTTIPATESKRLVVLHYLRDRCFTKDRPYLEKEVNQRLAIFHPDVASLRRYMVDAGLLTRAGGEYRVPEATAAPLSDGR